MQLNSKGRLRLGRHKLSTADVEQLFVVKAPNSAERRKLFQAFLSWREAITKLLPEHLLWVDGGFVTHKSDAPSDIDVVVLIRNEDVLNALTPEQQVALESLLTYKHPSTKSKIQPMAGLVDAYICLRSKPDRTAYWNNMWQQVKEDQSARKGFLVVSPND